MSWPTLNLGRLEMLFLPAFPRNVMMQWCKWNGIWLLETFETDQNWWKFFFPTGLCLPILFEAEFNDATRTVQYEMLRATHWTGCGWLLYRGVPQTVLCIALPERFTYLGSSVFTPAAVYRERERVKMMSGGRRLALIINHLVPLSSTSASS